MRWLTLSLMLAACAESEPSTVARSIELRALTVSGEPLPGLRAWLDGALLGETQSDGVLAATLRGRPQQRLLLSWACPVAYEPPTGQRDIVLDRSAGGDQPPLKLDARCTPLEVEAALVVRATGAPAGVPVRVRDEVVAHTDADGLAHVLLRARRGSGLTVALDTSAYPALVPKNPVETFQLGGDDTILLLDRTLSTPRVKAKQLATRSSVEPQRRKPFRIE